MHASARQTFLVGLSRIIRATLAWRPMWACPACTLETDDEARVCCEACGCELDPLPPAKRNKPGAEGAQATPRRRSIESFFEKKS